MYTYDILLNKIAVTIKKMGVRVFKLTKEIILSLHEP